MKMANEILSTTIIFSQFLYIHLFHNFCKQPVACLNVAAIIVT
jgi:hypothetical protein